jgi:hypothetical protein
MDEFSLPREFDTKSLKMLGVCLCGRMARVCDPLAEIFVG